MAVAGRFRAGRCPLSGPRLRLRRTSRAVESAARAAPESSVSGRPDRGSLRFSRLPRLLVIIKKHLHCSFECTFILEMTLYKIHRVLQTEPYRRAEVSLKLWHAGPGDRDGSHWCGTGCPSVARSSEGRELTTPPLRGATGRRRRTGLRTTQGPAGSARRSGLSVAGFLGPGVHQGTGSHAAATVQLVPQDQCVDPTDSRQERSSGGVCRNSKARGRHGV